MDAMRWIFAILAAAMLVNSAVAFPLPRSGGAAVCLLMDEKPGADPVMANCPADFDIAVACYITLFKLGPDGMPQPYLCQDFELNWFDRDLGIILRHARFSSGAEITADDCKFTIERALRLRPDLAPPFLNIAGAGEFIDGDADSILGLVAASEDELTFHLESPPAALELLAALCNPALGIISKERYESTGRDYFRAPVTSGPFDYTLSGTGVILTPQPNFPFGLPWLDSIILRAGTGESAHLDFSVGSADLLEAPPAYYHQYKNDINLSKRLAEAGVMLEYVLLLDPDVPPLNEAAVRRAIRLCIDHRGLADVTLGGAALDTYKMPSEVAALDYRSLVGMAVASLRDYGDLGLYPVVLAYPDGDGRARLMAEKIAVNLKPLGIEVESRAIANLGAPGVEINTAMLLMPYPLSNVGKLAPQSVIGLAGRWGFGGNALKSSAESGGTAMDCCLPILRPQRLVVAGQDYITPILGLWGEIDFYRLSLG
jgi:ABC-type transport system substrate-binding protein